MKRVVITGIGILSCIGNKLTEVSNNLRFGKSGISFSKNMKELGLYSQVCGRVVLKKKK